MPRKAPPPAKFLLKLSASTRPALAAFQCCSRATPLLCGRNVKLRRIARPYRHPYDSPMPISLVERVGRHTNDSLATFGDFWRFVGRTFMWIFAGGLRWKNLRLLFPQLYDIGVRSVPVIAITGAFIGMVMAI